MYYLHGANYHISKRPVASPPEKQTQSNGHVLHFWFRSARSQHRLTRQLVFFPDDPKSEPRDDDDDPQRGQRATKRDIPAFCSCERPIHSHQRHGWAFLKTLWKRQRRPIFPQNRTNFLIENQVKIVLELFIGEVFCLCCEEKRCLKLLPLFFDDE